MIAPKFVFHSPTQTRKYVKIAKFCQIHEVEVQGIADGDIATGIKAYNPILAGQLTREEIELSSKDENRPLKLNISKIEITNKERNLFFISRL